MAASHVNGGARMWVVAAALGALYLLSTLPTPLYVVYQRRFGFGEVMLTFVYAAYVVGSVSAMFLLGRLSDQVGRRPVLLMSVAVAAAAAVVFLCVQGTAWLFPARILSGLAIALAGGAGIAWMAELESGDDPVLATRVNIGANNMGLGLGALLAGVLAEWAPAPLHLSYAVYLVLLVPAAVLIWHSPRTKRDPTPVTEVSRRPRLGVPRELRGRFLAQGIGAMAVFAVQGFYGALIPTLLGTALHNDNHATAGAIVAGLYIFGIAAVMVKPQLDLRRGLIVALATLLPGVVLLVLAEALRSMSLLVIATVIGGVASGLGYRCTLQSVNAMSPDDRKSEVVSTYLIFVYAGISVPVIGIGFLSGVVGSLAADIVFAAVVAALAIGAMVMEIRRPAEEGAG